MPKSERKFILLRVSIFKTLVSTFYQDQNILHHGLRTPREEIAFTARPKIHSHSQIFRYGGSIFWLPHRPIFSDILDLCLHWVPVVRAPSHQALEWGIWTNLIS